MEAAAAPNPGWRKSSHSGNGGSSCVEAGHIPGAVLIRDTTLRGQGPVVRVSTETGRQFTAAIRDAS